MKWSDTAASLIDGTLGPLASFECRRASSRGWIFLGLTVATAIASAVVLFAMGAWWVMQRATPLFMPYELLRVSAWLIASGLTVVALILPPALLAGIIAGERERGSLGLLLTTRLSAFEILLGRLAGRISMLIQVNLIVWPMLAFLLWLAGFSLVDQAVLFGFFLAVSLGSAGLTLAASAWAARSRDSLLGTYLVLLGLILSPLALSSLDVLNPFAAPAELFSSDSREGCLVTSLLWLLLGVVGFALACTRVRKAGGATASRRFTSSRWRVPEVSDVDPMLWKELHVDRVATFGRASRMLVGLLIAWLALGPVVIVALEFWDQNVAPVWSSGYRGADILRYAYGYTSIPMICLIAGVMALRASVSIASERERGTWDALLTSPLEAREIIRAKIRGNLHALRWLMASAVFAWFLTTLYNPDDWVRLIDSLIALAVVGVSLTALGVRISLSSQGATKAMATTAASALGLHGLSVIIAGVTMLVGAIGCIVLWMYMVNYGYADANSRPNFFVSGFVAFRTVYYLTMLSIGLAFASETALSFDRLAGRMTEGQTALKYQKLLGYGRRTGEILTRSKPKPPANASGASATA